MSKIVVAYTRVSTIGQTIDQLGNLKEDHSAKVQADRCFNYYMNVVNSGDHYERLVLEDLACSGSTIDRPQYKKMISLIKAGKIRAVIVTELSRISRKILDFYKAN